MQIFRFDKEEIEMAKVRKLWEGNIVVWDDGQVFYATTSLGDDSSIVGVGKSASDAAMWLIHELDATWGVLSGTHKQNENEDTPQ
jgi:hypothetical protein